MTPRRGWAFALALSAALLVVPMLAWLLLPRAPAPPPRTQRPRTVEAAAAPTFTSSPRAPAVQPPPARPAMAKDDEEPAADGVKGKVVDAEGQPVLRAFVVCDDRDRNLTAYTDESGSFVLPPEASGCNAVAHHAEHPSSERVRVDAGKDNLISLGRGGSIEGVVVDDSGSPVPSYRLVVELYLPKTEGLELGTRGRPKTVEDAAGAFRWDRLPEGRYVIVATAEGRPPGKSETIEVEAGRSARNVKITLPRAATLTGNVLDETSGRPIAGATVHLDGMTSGGSDPIPPATTDERGEFSLAGVPPGPFSVRVDREGFMVRTISGIKTGGASVVRQEITLRPRGDGGASSELEGVGAILSPSSTGIQIAALVEGGPAAEAGLRRGDRLVRIDGTSAEEMTLSDAMQRLRGPSGSRVTVTVARENEGTVEVTVVRGRIER
ncbi:carboxypeptidase regulatory-like domain-containing protein [Polyangium aurulentum]|uniref:carboxypeptidase regulatory-like domain-containing protein n=1 Tax=Polyangium aurulentum TaxID=2567896 RepID=UPI0010AE41F9|nr:carboxypeptidase regulatory-like domain-containing protein [Polyangium aurulentum]UQA61070.1 carboxypeptidase regulatory-like domain-containing protein [Polyangium aurulentum]